MKIFLILIYLLLIGCKSEEYEFPKTIENFSIVSKDYSLALSWGNPQQENFAGVKILRKEKSTPLSTTDGTVVYFSNGTSYVDSQLENDVEYFYTAYSYDFDQNRSSGKSLSGTPTATIPENVMNLQATFSNNIIYSGIIGMQSYSLLKLKSILFLFLA